jgi:hypothetical protein
MGLDYFKEHGFDLYDAYGHRLLRRSQVKILGGLSGDGLQAECKTDAGHARLSGQFWSCTRNFPINVPAHACVNGDDYDFTADLAGRYDLPPGEYTVRLREGQGDNDDLCKMQKGPLYLGLPGKDLIFSVIQP